MEGPSLVIACEEFERFKNTKPKAVSGTAKIPLKALKGRKFLGARSWGKHFLLQFDDLTLRVHFLMFGSYRIDDPRENRVPKMTLKFPGGTVQFYSCAIKVLEEPIDEIYDWSIDTMSSEWSNAKALKALRAKPDQMICDSLMDQDIFAGVGNIIKNEVQFRQRLHPETRFTDLTTSEQRSLVSETVRYCHQFYAWKKANVLKRNWLIMRKKKCPLCGRAVKKAPTGKLQRLSHWCPLDQKLRPSLTGRRVSAKPTASEKNRKPRRAKP